MNKKKRYILILSLLLIISLTYVSTFLVRQNQFDNVVTFGNLKLQIINHTLDSNGHEIDVTHDEEKLKYSNVNRIVKIKNICNNDMYVRVKVDLKGKDINNQEYEPDSYVNINGCDDAWIYQDGWYYYQNVLKPNVTTENLLDGLEFDMDKLTSHYPGSDIELNIKAQAVQSTHNASQVLEASGWPKEGI